MGCAEGKEVESFSRRESRKCKFSSDLLTRHQRPRSIPYGEVWDDEAENGPCATT